MKCVISNTCLFLTFLPGFSVSLDRKLSSLRGANRQVNPGYSASDYVYSINNDCYKEGNECPTGTFCQVEERDNWYPYDVSYINRGRCLPFAKVGHACDVEFDGATSFPRKANGDFFDRGTLCGPSTTCTGDHIFVLPPTCVQARDPGKGCMSTQTNGCAGRPSLGECPDDRFCFYPQAFTDGKETTVAANEDTTRQKLEQCATLLTSFNGPDFALTMGNGERPDDNHIEAGETKLMTKKSIAHGSRMAPKVQHILETLWPYPVCGKQDVDPDHCTSFPLPIPARDNDGGLVAGKCLQFTNTQDAKQLEVNCDDLNSPVELGFLQANSTSGATDYHCTWAVLHTLSFNGGAVLSASEKRAFNELLLYISGQFDCKVCRNNFVNIIKHFGLPQGNIREDYARWLWQAHNNANEHSYATHSLDLQQAETKLRQSTSVASSNESPFSQTRTDEWTNPTYEHPWYMPFEDAASVWTGI